MFDVWAQLSSSNWIYTQSFILLAKAFAWIERGDWQADDLMVIRTSCPIPYYSLGTIDLLDYDVVYQWSKNPHMEEAYETQIEISTGQWISVRRFEESLAAMQWCQEQTSYRQTIRVVKAIWPTLSLRRFTDDECRLVMCYCTWESENEQVDWKQQGF